MFAQRQTSKFALFCYPLPYTTNTLGRIGDISYFCTMKKENYEISRQMHEDLMKAYIDVYASCWSQKEAYERTARHPAPRYYISPKQASQIISPMVRGDFELVDLMHPHKRNMYYALFEEVKKLSEQRAFIGKSLSYIMQYAVLQPAPEFFISWDHVKRIRLWLKRGIIGPDGKVDQSRVGFYRRYYERRK